jgi:hypothetical protein
MFWLWPRLGNNASVSWPEEEPILRTPSRVYTAANLTTALLDIGYPLQAEIAAAVLADNDLAEFAAPGVDTVVIYGSGVPTPIGADYTQELMPTGEAPPPTMLYGSGDNIVPVRSSLRSQGWSSAQAASGHILQHWEYPGQGHASCIFYDKTCFQDIVTLLRQPRP